MSSSESSESSTSFYEYVSDTYKSLSESIFESPINNSEIKSEPIFDDSTSESESEHESEYNEKPNIIPNQSVLNKLFKMHDKNNLLKNNIKKLEHQIYKLEYDLRVEHNNFISEQKKNKNLMFLFSAKIDDFKILLESFQIDKSPVRGFDLLGMKPTIKF